MISVILPHAFEADEASENRETCLRCGRNIRARWHFETAPIEILRLGYDEAPDMITVAYIDSSIFFEGEAEKLIEAASAAVYKHNISADQLIEAIELSAELADYGLHLPSFTLGRLVALMRGKDRELDHGVSNGEDVALQAGGRTTTTAVED